MCVRVRVCVCVFVCLEVTIARKIDTSCLWFPLPVFPMLLSIAAAPEDAEGIAFGSWLEVFSAGPLSCFGDGGGVG